MLSFTGGLKIFVALQPCDMRKGFGSLCGAVYNHLKEDARNEALYVLASKRRTRFKILYCDGTGMWLLTKRLDASTLFWPRSSQAGQTKMALTPEVFALLTDGIDHTRARCAPGMNVPWRDRYKKETTFLATRAGFAHHASHHDESPRSPADPGGRGASSGKQAAA